MLFKYVWLISAEKISFIWPCYGSNKSDGLHNKSPYTSGNIKWCSFVLRFCVSNPKSAWKPLLPSAKGLYFTLCLLHYARVKVILTFPFFHFILSQAPRVGKILIHISNWMFVSMNYYCWHYPWGKTLGGNIKTP